MRKLFSALALPAVLFTAAPSQAFTEDICYPSDDGGIFNCTPLPAACAPAGTDTPACRQAAILTYAQFGAKYPDARSTIHVDTPYILAQAVGFSATDAYWIAAYSEATDRGTFEPRDETGALVGGGALKTATLTGLERNDFGTGGTLIHFSAPRNETAAAPVPGIDGLHPDPTDENHEILLTHLRDWAMAGSGAARVDCAGGLTNASTSGDNATGTTCYATGGNTATISGSVIFFDGPKATESDADIQTFTVKTGLQIIQDSDAGQATSDTFDAVVGGTAQHIADARLGVYIHAFGDRTSHHVCLDDSYLYGPTSAGASWTADMTSSQCSQGLHTLRHIWETGVDFSLLTAENQTTSAYLGNAYTEMVAFATARGVLSTSASDPTAQAKLISDLTSALETTDVTARLAALRSLTCARGLVAFPGEAPCPGSDGGVDLGDAGISSDSGASSSGDGGAGGGTNSDAATGDSGGCTVSGNDDDGPLGAGLLLGLGIAATWGARRRSVTAAQAATQAATQKPKH